MFAGYVAGVGGVSEILFRCVSRCLLKLAVHLFCLVCCLISLGMMLKRAGPDDQNELNLSRFYRSG